MRHYDIIIKYKGYRSIFGKKERCELTQKFAYVPKDKISIIFSDCLNTLGYSSIDISFVDVGKIHNEIFKFYNSNIPNGKKVTIVQLDSYTAYSGELTVQMRKYAK